jgi:hypothetical protein
VIKTNYTTKLFFGQYTTKITINTHIPGKKNYGYRFQKPKELRELHNYCKENFVDGYVVKDHWCGADDGVLFHQMIYLNNTFDRDALLARFGARVLEITQPFDSDHKNSLEIRNLTVVRNILLYNKYQHCVYFKYDPTHNTYNWLKAFFKDEVGHKLVPDPNRDYTYPVWPRVYLTDSTHLMSLKLMWSERIEYVKTVHLIS